MNPKPNRNDLQLTRQSPIQRNPFTLAWCTLALLLFSAGCTIMPIQPTAPQVNTTPATVTEQATVTSTQEITETVTIVGGNEETLRQFLRQYFVQPFASNNETNTTLYIGALPDDLPFNLELPDGMTVAGSVVTTGEFPSTQLILAAQQNAVENVNVLREQLLDQGYTRPTQSGNEIFQSQSNEYAPLCSPDDRFMVMLNGVTMEDGAGTLHIYLNNVEPFGSPCTMEATQSSSNPFEAIAPTLTAPANISVYSSGAGSSGDSFEASISFTGETTIAALSEHYEAQLQAAGWQQSGAGQTEDVAWSGWTITEGDQQYAATFYIVRSARSSDRFQATMRLETALSR